MEKYLIKFNDQECNIYQKDNKLYINYDDLKKLVSCNLHFINEFLDYNIKNMQRAYYLDNNSYIEEDNIRYFDVNVVYIMMNEFNNKIANDFILSLKELKLDLNIYIWNYIIDMVNNKNEDNLLLKDLHLFEDAFQTLAKTRKSDGYCYHLYSFKYASEYEYLELLDKIRIENNLPDNFGELKMDLEKLIDELYFDCDNVNTALNASNIFYTLIKEKPFVSYNYEIALIIAIKTLSDTNSVKYRLDDENCFVGNDNINVSSSDFIYALQYIENNLDKPKLEVIKKIEPLFCFKDLTIKDYKKQELLSLIKQDNSLENIYRYIIYFTEHYHGYQGFYEFYKGKQIYCYKIHYHGEYYDLKFSYTKSDLKNNIFVFEGNAKAYTEAPTDLCGRISTIIELYDEIKQRSYSCIMENYIEELKKELEPYFDLNQLKISFELKWTYEIDEDYEW